MYNTSNNYKEKVFLESTKHLLRIFIDNTEVMPQYIAGFEPLLKVFTGEEFTLGSVCSMTVKLKLHKNAIEETCNNVRVTTGIVGEEIPFGTFRVVDKKEVDENTIELDLEDNMTKFEGNYDGSTLSYPATLITILQDICSKKGVELRFYFFFEYE